MPPADEVQRIPDLPTEIYISIVDQWALMCPSRGAEWFKGLSALSRSSKFLSYPAQRHIFHSITLGSDKVLCDGAEDRMRDLVRILSCSPHLIKYVKCVAIRWGGDIWGEELVAKILTKVHELESLTLYGSIYPQRAVKYIYWQRLDSSLRLELRRIISSPSLTTLRLLWWEDFPLDILRSARHITSLSMSGVSTIEARTRSKDVVSVGLSKPPAKVKTFHMLGEMDRSWDMLFDSDPIGPSTDPVFDFSDLETIWLLWRTVDDIQTTKKLAMYSPPIRNISLKVFKEFDSTISGLAESILYKSSKSLEELTFEIPALPTDSDLTDPLYGLSEELSALSGDATGIRTVNVYITSTGAVTALSQLIEVAFPSLDQALSTGFPALTRLNVTMIHKNPQDRPKEFRDAFNGSHHFPKINAVERITFKMYT